MRRRRSISRENCANCPMSQSFRLFPTLALSVSLQPLAGDSIVTLGSSKVSSVSDVAEYLEQNDMIVRRADPAIYRRRRRNDSGLVRARHPDQRSQSEMLGNSSGKMIARVPSARRHRPRTLDNCSRLSAMIAPSAYQGDLSLGRAPQSAGFHSDRVQTAPPTPICGSRQFSLSAVKTRKPPQTRVSPRPRGKRPGADFAKAEGTPDLLWAGWSASSGSPIFFAFCGARLAGLGCFARLVFNLKRSGRVAA